MRVIPKSPLASQRISGRFHEGPPPPPLESFVSLKAMNSFSENQGGLHEGRANTMFRGEQCPERGHLSMTRKITGKQGTKLGVP